MWSRELPKCAAALRQGAVGRLAAPRAPRAQMLWRSSPWSPSSGAKFAGGRGVHSAAWGKSALAEPASVRREPSETPRRSFAAQSGDPDHEEAKAFIVEKGWSADVAAGVVATLAKAGSGVPRGAVATMVRAMAGRPEVGEDAGLEALCKSVMQEVGYNQGKTVVKFTVHPPNAKPFGCEAIEGMSLKDVAEHGIGEGASILREYIECACSGVMACSTCHVYIDEKHWEEVVGAPSEAEMDMIELAHEPKDNSRLGCQIKLDRSMDGMVVTIPSGANNLFDHIPFD